MRDYNDYTKPELQLLPVETNAKQDDNSIPLDLTTDILSICRSYSLLGLQIQQQVETIIELGVDEAIASKTVSATALPHIRAFLKQVIDNPLFGDAADQAADTVQLIDNWAETHPSTHTMN